jgi:glycosyltransferase involved in cell wall biosynthesis
VPEAKAKRVLIDARDLNHDAGMGTHTRGLLKLLELLPEDKYSFTLALGNDVEVESLPSFPSNFTVTTVNKALPGFFGDFVFHLKAALRSFSYDLFFVPVSKISPVFSRNPIITVYDMSVFEKGFQKNRKAKVIETLFLLPAAIRARKVICISHSTRNLFLQKFSALRSILENRTVVVPAITNDISLIAPDDSALKKFDLKKDGYIYYVGKIEPRKNLERLIYSYAKLSNELKNAKKSAPKLVLSGSKGWHSDEIYRSVKKLELENSILFTGRVSDSEKRALLENCLFFAFPSLYEGFGFPVLEALQLRKPVLTSLSTSLPEVGGKHALYCNPFSVDSLADGMLKLSTDPDLRTSLIEDSEKYAKKFSLEALAEQIEQHLR